VAVDGVDADAGRVVETKAGHGATR
jgi:hypothetical protein